MPVTLKNKVIVVTGATAGIGEAIVEALIKENAIVVGLARRKDRLDELTEKYPSQFHGIQTDVSKESDIKSAFEQIQAKFDSLDGLINNAGISRASSLSTGDTQDWRDVLETNVIGLCICSREAIAIMNAKDTPGYIINVNSVAGHRIPPSLGHLLNIYGGSKHAVTAISESLKCELLMAKSKIRITSLSPGYVLTDLIKSAKLEEYTEDFTSLAPSLMPSDIAESVIFLLTRPEHVEIQELTIKPHGELF